MIHEPPAGEAWRTAARRCCRGRFGSAHGAGRCGRSIRGDATVDGLVRRMERHFGLDRYGFEVRIVHGRSGRRVPVADEIRKYRAAEE